MTIDSWRLLGRWALWLAILVVATAILISARDQIDQSHAALTLLLVVLGGSAGGGRTLGFVLAVLGFILLDYYFQPPFDLLSVDKTNDWIVLVAFLTSAFVATELLTHARAEANTARERSEEIASLSRLGSETLRYDRPEDALAAVAELVRGTLRVHHTVVRSWDPIGGLSTTPTAAVGDAAADAETSATTAAVASGQSGASEAVAVLRGGAIVRGQLDEVAARSDAQSIAFPLLVEGRLVGVLLVSAREAGRLVLDASQRRFLGAIGYYAALGAERVRLASEAEYAREWREANRAKDEVLATVSHDLRTPLTTIKLLAQSAATRGEPTAAVIEEQVDRLAELVTNVLDLSRLRAGGVSLDLELNTAEDLLGAAINRSKGVMRGRTVVARVDLNAPALAGRFDFVQSLRIVGNLLDNALRHSPPAGLVELFADRDGAWLVIRVADRGPGVAMQERERIFEPFYRPRSEAPDAGHAGLGLSIARQLAELQHGSLEYELRDGGGSSFVLRLPAAEWSTAALGEREQGA